MTSFSAFADQYFPPRRAESRPYATAGMSARSVETLAFTHALVALAAQLSAIDGAPKKSEYLAFQSLFVAEGEADEGKLRSLFVKHVGEGTPTLQYARQITAITTGQIGLRQEIFARFVRIATADGMLNAAEMEWLRAVGAAFELEGEAVRTAIGQCFTNAAASPYAMLGISPKAGDAELRAAYMARVHALHPDRFQAAGASDETIHMLSQQLAAVNAAYETACKARKKSAFAPRLWSKRDKSAEAAA